MIHSKHNTILFPWCGSKILTSGLMMECRQKWYKFLWKKYDACCISMISRHRSVMESLHKSMWCNWFSDGLFFLLFCWKQENMNLGSSKENLGVLFFVMCAALWRVWVRE
jgi:hypothetical protein